MSFEPYAPLGEMPFPPGVHLPVGFPQIGDISKQLGLAVLGVFTPWAARESGVTWQPVKQPPDTNVAVMPINDQLVAAAQALAFNQPIPFVAILTQGATPPSPDHVATVLKGTPYRFYQTQAVYSQADKAPVPRISFLHWAENRQPGDSDGGPGSLVQAASNLSGKLAYATQVNYSSSALRTPPSTSFQSALEMQSGPMPTPSPPPTDLPPPPTEPPPTEAATMVTALVVGAAAAAAGFMIMRSQQKAKP